MSLSLFRQAFHRSQPLLCRQTTQLIAVRFMNSTGRQQNDAPWNTVIKAETTSKPFGGSYHSQTMEDMWKRNSDYFFSQRHTTRNAYSGRSASVQNGDVAQAAKLLDRVLTQNNVPRDWFTNRRHRQKGEERRRLKSLRYKRRFKHEVGEKVQLVQQIRRRGA